MDSLELLIRKRLGQKNFEPINGRKHKRFDFSCDNKKNKKIIELFNDFELLFKVDEFGSYGGKILEIFELKFYKGECKLLYEEMDIDVEHFDCKYYNVIIKDYSGYGTVAIIKDIILEHSINYKEIIREEKLNKLLTL
jgi:hypothetical protein